MKYLKNISLFKFVIFLILNVFFKSLPLLILSIFYLLIQNKKELIFFFCLLFLTILFNNYHFDFMPVGIVEERNSSYVIVDKIFYKTLLYDDLSIGDVILSKSSNKITDERLLKYNYRYYLNEYEKVFNFGLRKKINDRFDLFDIDIKANLRKILLNKYSEEGDISYLGYGFAFYYILLYYLRNKPYFCTLLLFLYIFLFGIDIKFYLIIIELFTIKHLKGLNKLSIKILFLLFLNQYLLLNNSILLSLIFSYYYNSEFKTDKSLILAIQSFFFYETNILSIFIYKYLIMMRIFLFIVSFFTFSFPFLASLYLQLINFISLIYSLFNISIRGQIPLLILLLLYLFFKLINLNYIYRIIIIICMLILPLYNLGSHISFIDVGQGDATFISDNFKTVLIDTGSKYNYHKLKKELYRQGIYNIDYLIISHNDEDHSGNIETLKKDFKIGRLIYDGEDISLKGSLLHYLNTGTYDNDNDNSLIYLFEDKNIKVLFPGDISKKVELMLIEKFSLDDIDIIHCAHHGSSTSSDEYFIGSLNAKAAIISTNGKYNHPALETIETLNKFQLEIFSTKEERNIHLYHIFNKYLLCGSLKIMVLN